MGILQNLIEYFLPREEAHFPGIPFIDLADPKIVSAPNPEDFYPPYSKHAGEVGIVRVLLGVDACGEVNQSRIVKSSGYARLDQAAINLCSRFLFDTQNQGLQSGFQTSVEIEFKRPST